MNKREIGSFYTYLQSERTAQQFLLQCYEKIIGVDAEAKSYENCHAFLYYLEHGKQFYKSGQQLSIIVQPILFFYGMVHLLKATLLTKRPNYPETTKILAHGVSSRKRKKKHYTFMEDEVKTHHNGLFPYFSKHLFSINVLPTEKFNMTSLFSFIPEMTPLFNFHQDEKMIEIGMIGTRILQFPLHLLDKYYLTEKAFLHRISPYLPKINDIKTNETMIQVELTEPIRKSFGPFFLNLSNKMIYFPIHRDDFLPISEIMVHYLLLYNLSMLCRYETEWWGELLGTKSEIDYPFISHFLQHTAEKIPLLLGQEIYDIYSNI